MRFINLILIFESVNSSTNVAPIWIFKTSNPGISPDCYNDARRVVIERSTEFLATKVADTCIEEKENQDRFIALLVATGLHSINCKEGVNWIWLKK
jgi:hypothetical protein